jgi:6,7-dimethyl-8-ribityllumazine synthase
MIQDPVRVLIVEARYYNDLSDQLLAGAKRALQAAGAEFNVISVPGALEIPAAIAFAEESGRFPVGVRYDGYVALGCVIRGETYHFEVVSNESARGLMDLGIGHRLCIGNGILTTEDEDQAQWRADPNQGDKGGGAARACLDLIALKRRLRGASA